MNKDICTHSKWDQIITKDETMVYEVCAFCGKLRGSMPRNALNPLSIQYQAPVSKFTDLFHADADAFYYSSVMRMFYKAGKNLNPAPKIYAEEVILPSKKPLFFTNMSKEDTTIV